MKRFQSLHQPLVGWVLFPLLNSLYNRKGILPQYLRLIESERFSEERLREIQFRKLRILLKYSQQRIPFYAARFKEIGMDPEDVKELDDIARIPPLSREEVVENRLLMVDTRYRDSAQIADNSLRRPGMPLPLARFRRHRLVRNTSSGSTGAPTVFYEDGSTTALNWGHELRLKKWFGNSPGAKEARFVRASNEQVPHLRTQRWRQMFWNQLILPGVNLSKADCEYCHQRLLEFNPTILWGFTSALTAFADFLTKTVAGTLSYHPKVVITWAAPLYKHEKEILSSAFACPVTNIYGMREVGHVAAFCPSGSLHLNQENFIVETDNHQVETLTPRSGELLVTTLHRSIMPFIRYRTGDVGTLDRSQCPCGRTLGVISDFLGRTGEVFWTKTGRLISPNFWCRTFMDVRLSTSIRRFQIHYLSSDEIRIDIVPDKTFTPDTEGYLLDKLWSDLSSDIRIDIRKLTEIEAHISGKYQMVVNHQHPEDRNLSFQTTAPATAVHFPHSARDSCEFREPDHGY